MLFNLKTRENKIKKSKQTDTKINKQRANFPRKKNTKKNKKKQQQKKQKKTNKPKQTKTKQKTKEKLTARKFIYQGTRNN